MRCGRFKSRAGARVVNEYVAPEGTVEPLALLISHREFNFRGNSFTVQPAVRTEI